MSVERHGGVRAVLAEEAARLMLEEGVKQYLVAKRIAAKRLLGRDARGARFRASDLPSNGEIRDSILALAERSEGKRRTRRLFAMRVTALEVMRAVEAFEPRLIGSVSTGHVRKGSDIDLSMFTRDEGGLEGELCARGWAFERERVSIQKAGKIAEYVHYHVDHDFPVELTIYDPAELRARQRSSTDGKPIVRMRVAEVEALVQREHAEAWERYRESGEIAGLDEILAVERDHDGPAMPALGFDGWLDVD